MLTLTTKALKQMKRGCEEQRWELSARSNPLPYRHAVAASFIGSPATLDTGEPGPRI